VKICLQLGIIVLTNEDNYVALVEIIIYLIINSEECTPFIARCAFHGSQKVVFIS